ncbi:MFS transporter [Streptomyces sp. WMMB 322]|uniref:MFS transporter n=1 Tax=Streptomyces sp. WMMB 322 TaxID=1286821 RepID=UPI0020C7A903|nr:MFS transporter [Streptomyces sp. WMMB 322]
MLRLVVSFAFLQGAVSMARPAVSYHALELGAGARAVGVVTAAFALLPLVVAVPLGRRTDRQRCGPLLPAGVALVAAGCALAGTAPSLVLLAAWSALLGLGHLVFMIGAQSLVARQSGADRHDRNFGHFTIGGSAGQLTGPVLSGWLVGGAGAGGPGSGEHASAVALFGSCALAFCSYATLWRLEGRAPERRQRDGAETDGPPPLPVPVARILRSRGVPAGIFASLAVLSTTDVLTAYLPVVGEERGIAPGVVGLLLSLRAAASVLSRAWLTRMTARLGRQPLLVVSCSVAGLLCVLLAVPLPLWTLVLAMVVLGFCLGVGQPLTMTTVVQAAPGRARSTALALRLTGNRLGQVAAPAAAGLVAGAAGAAAPFVLLGALLLGASATAAPWRAGRRDTAGEACGAGGAGSSGSAGNAEGGAADGATGGREQPAGPTEAAGAAPEAGAVPEAGAGGAGGGDAVAAGRRGRGHACPRVTHGTRRCTDTPN